MPILTYFACDMTTVFNSCVRDVSQLRQLKVALVSHAAELIKSVTRVTEPRIKLGLENQPVL